MPEGPAVPPDFSRHQNPGTLVKTRCTSLGRQHEHVACLGRWRPYPSAFFEACDKAGMLVWQDFMFACAMVPDNPEFVENVRQEALEQVNRLRHYSSLALWCGNNEVERALDLLGVARHVRVADQTACVLQRPILGCSMRFFPICGGESNLHYLPTSPHSELQVATNTHGASGLGSKTLTTTARHGGRFVSEYGLQSLPCKHTLHEAGITSWEDEALQFRQRSRMDGLEPGFDGWDMMHHFMSRPRGSPTKRPRRLDFQESMDPGRGGSSGPRTASDQRRSVCGFAVLVAE